MEHQVIADIEIEDEKISYYSSVSIKQQFNAHHEFLIRIKYDVLEKIGTFTLGSAQRKIGKMAIIKLAKADSFDVAYEFRGIICEVGMEQADNFISYLTLKGYSPTILLENGPHLLSFYQKDLSAIVQQLTAPLQGCCRVNVNPQYKAQIKYICQYRESTFHFLNRLSSDFADWCYYDGIDLFFGKPSSPEIQIEYGADVHQLQVKLRILPLTFSSYSYLSKNDEVISVTAPANIEGLDEYANFAMQESGKIFTEPVNIPVRQRVENKSDLEGFVKKQKTAMAADLEVLSGSSSNPPICIGAIAEVKVATRENNALNKEEYGKFLITGIEHHLTENKRYYNSFEGIPAGIEAVPVKSVILPIAEPQIATVKDNKDPDNLGRVRVQMLWQQDSNEMTDWIRVMTPDAGGGKDGAKNRGLVVVPEAGDQVLVCFRYNDPDRPFVMGSLFHGKTGGGGGQGNKSKSLTALSDSKISLDGDSITIKDAKGNKIFLDGTGNIEIQCTGDLKINAGKSIQLNCNNKSFINLKDDGTIELKGIKSVSVLGINESVKVHSNKLVDVRGIENTKINSLTKVEIGAPSTEIKGEMTLTLASAVTQIAGTTTTEVKGGTLLLNC